MSSRQITVSIPMLDNLLENSRNSLSAFSSALQIWLLNENNDPAPVRREQIIRLATLLRQMHREVNSILQQC